MCLIPTRIWSHMFLLGTGKTTGLYLGSERVSSVMGDHKGGDAHPAVRVSFPL